MPNKPLPKSYLRQIFAVYREAFPEWNVEHGVMLTRTEWPIKQILSFQLLSSGAYRPSSAIAVLPTPEPYCLFTKFLDIKHRVVFPREHATKWQEIVKAMKEQFVPDICRPLDVADVFRLIEERVASLPTVKPVYSICLAVLNLHVGDRQRASWWCSQVEKQILEFGRERSAGEAEQSDFAFRLIEAITRGDDETFLQGVANHSSTTE